MLRQDVVTDFQVVIVKLRLVNDRCGGSLQVLYHQSYLVDEFILLIKRFSSISYGNCLVCTFVSVFRCFSLKFKEVSVVNTVDEQIWSMLLHFRMKINQRENISKYNVKMFYTENNWHVINLKVNKQFNILWSTEL